MSETATIPATEKPKAKKAKRAAEVSAERGDELIAAVAAWEKSNQHWADSPGTQPPDASWWEAAAEIVAVWATGPLPSWARAVVDSVRQLGEAIAKVGSQVDVDWNDESPEGTPVSRCIDDLVKAIAHRDKPLSPPRQTFAELLALGADGGTKVPLAQYARIWRLKNRWNEPDLAAVQKEIAEPGSVITPEYVATLEAQDEEEFRRELERQPDWTALTALAASMQSIGLVS